MLLIFFYKKNSYREIFDKEHKYDKIYNFFFNLHSLPKISPCNYS